MLGTFVRGPGRFQDHRVGSSILSTASSSRNSSLDQDQRHSPGEATLDPASQPTMQLFRGKIKMAIYLLHRNIRVKKC